MEIHPRVTIKHHYSKENGYRKQEFGKKDSKSKKKAKKGRNKAKKIKT